MEPCRAADPPSHLVDLRDWQRLGLPAAANWNVVGMQAWHVAQVKAGHRVIPSVQLPNYAPPGTAGVNAGNPKILDRILAGFDFAYLRDNNVPICIRTNNICDAFNDERYRPPAVSKLVDSPVVWRMLEDGNVDTTQLIDPFGPLSNWQNEGKLWATTPYMQQLQSKYASPPFVLFVENNEGRYDNPKRYTAERDRSGKWLPPEQLAFLSLRMREYVMANSGTTLFDFYPVLWAKREAQWKAFYAAFDAALSQGWQGKILTVGYGSIQPEPGRSVADCYDAGSPRLYVGGGARADFTALLHIDALEFVDTWKELRSRNPRAYREASTFLGPNGALGGAKAGKHELITPTHWDAYAQYLLWSMQEPGVPVLLRRYSNSPTRAAEPFFPRETHAELDALGGGALKRLTIDDYQQPELKAVDRICTDQVLREFWLKGTPVEIADAALYPRLLTCDANTRRSLWSRRNGQIDTSASIKVWSLATRAPNGDTLVFAWSPCKLTEKITVSVPDRGDISIEPPQPWGYWVVGEDKQVKTLAIAK
jgi:hypothetical protein